MGAGLRPFQRHYGEGAGLVRVPSLPAEYFDIIFLRKLGNRIGRKVRVDQATSLVSRGMFSQICVEIDMRKPLISKFTYEGKVRHVAYEGMHMVYFSCWFYGHAKDACPSLRRLEDDRGDGMADAAVAEHYGVRPGNTEIMDPKILYGAWMIAPVRRGRPTSKPAERTHRQAKVTEAESAMG
ncbi:PREDICTED: uncharacterized protein LOC109179171 [Ipomoea nil]|uniref:uncharacterized protein LOC109179171 n=1 Tax=Ipomoea nil TaxID=35883 RepID=UPI000901DD41|nr:PREDICTED: uncharacterized protein LOC109179171 [Ipomoea nil]